MRKASFSSLSLLSTCLLWLILFSDVEGNSTSERMMENDQSDSDRALSLLTGGIIKKKLNRTSQIPSLFGVRSMKQSVVKPKLVKSKPKLISLQAPIVHKAASPSTPSFISTPKPTSAIKTCFDHVEKGRGDIFKGSQQHTHKFSGVRIIQRPVGRAF